MSPGVPTRVVEAAEAWDREVRVSSKAGPLTRPVLFTG